MVLPRLPPEIIHRIIQFAQPPHFPFLTLERKATFRRLALVSVAWYPLAKAEFYRWFNVPADLGILPTPAREGKGINLAQVRFVATYPDLNHENYLDREPRSEEYRVTIELFTGLEKLWYHIDQFEEDKLPSVWSWLVAFPGKPCWSAGVVN